MPNTEKVVLVLIYDGHPSRVPRGTPGAIAVSPEDWREWNDHCEEALIWETYWRELGGEKL